MALLRVFAVSVFSASAEVFVARPGCLGCPETAKSAFVHGYGEAMKADAARKHSFAENANEARREIQRRGVENAELRNAMMARRNAVHKEIMMLKEEANNVNHRLGEFRAGAARKASEGVHGAVLSGMHGAGLQGMEVRNTIEIPKEYGHAPGGAGGR